MFDYEDRAMFVPDPTKDKAADARSLAESVDAADHGLDAQLAWLGGIGLIATFLFAFFLGSRV